MLAANPLKPAGALPALSLLSLDHCEPQKVTVLPRAALWSPSTKDPRFSSVIDSTFTEVEPELPSWR